MKYKICLEKHSEKVRCELAEFSSDVNLLKKLGEDECEAVREKVLNNPIAPEEMLIRFAQEDNWKIRQAIAGNPNTPPEVLLKLSKDDVSDVRKAVIANPNASAEVCTIFSKSGDWEERQAVAENRNLPLLELQKLLKDDDSDVKASALASICTRIGEMLPKFIEYLEQQNNPKTD